jgi:hypothetical protein
MALSNLDLPIAMNLCSLNFVVAAEIVGCFSGYSFALSYYFFFSCK